MNSFFFIVLLGLNRFVPARISAIHENESEFCDHWQEIEDSGKSDDFQGYQVVVSTSGFAVTRRVTCRRELREVPGKRSVHVEEPKQPEQGEGSR